jgi:hypothetical protein
MDDEEDNLIVSPLDDGVEISDNVYLKKIKELELEIKKVKAENDKLKPKPIINTNDDDDIAALEAELNNILK